MKLIICIILLITIFSCKESPNYNPFDDQFDVSVRQLIRDNCDKSSAQCGYYNFTRNYGKLRPYYQIYSEDYYQVVAKGFEYRIDTFRIKQYDAVYNDMYAHKPVLDSIIQLPINENSMNQVFGRYGYQVASRNLDTIKIVNRAKQDTLSLELEVYFDYRIRSIIRGISYFRTN